MMTVDDPAAGGLFPIATESIVERCLSGDSSGFVAMYDQYAPQVHRRLASLLGEASEAEDALQQTFLLAFRSLARFERRSSLSTWLHGIAVRVALNTIRGRKRRDRAMAALASESHVRDPQTRSPESSVDLAQQMQRLRRYLVDLPSETQVAFVLYFVEQLELSEVAALIGSTQKGVWVRLKRARERVRAAIEREGTHP